jgi:SAM-dependent methyltransferase
VEQSSKRIAFSFANSSSAKGETIRHLILASAACLNLLNVNAQKSMADYSETNYRDFQSYVFKLGSRFSFQLSGVSAHRAWLDVGAGYGLAALQKLMDHSVSHVTLINAQDSWGYILRPQSIEDAKARRVMRNLAVILKLGPVPYSPDGLAASQWTDLRSRARGTFDRLKRSGQLRYRVGRAETELPKLKKQYQILTDVFGAYFYSADRLNLLEEYYRLLSGDGEGFVLFQAEEAKLPPSKSTLESDTETFGPTSLADDRPFEKVLVEMFPSIFHIVTVKDGVGSYRALHIIKDPQIARLNLTEKFEIVSASLNSEHEISIQTEVPQIVIRKK